ncbi:MAG TPA: NfeD family protein [Blastocatellia bacterium]|nr:NfeD family protein [Blastocatellia bacterium]
MLSFDTWFMLGLLLAVPVVVFLIVLLRLVYRSRQAKITTGTAGMIGQVGRAETEIAHEGTVFVRGELWRASSYTRIAPGQTVRVVGLDGLTLKVEIEKDHRFLPRQASAIDGY